MIEGHGLKSQAQGSVKNHTMSQSKADEGHTCNMVFLRAPSACDLTMSRIKSSQYLFYIHTLKSKILVLCLLG